MDNVMSAFVVLVCAFAAYLIFVVLPVTMHAEAECLRNGYPKAQVTIGLERYCTTLDGAVTVKVDKQ